MPKYAVKIAELHLVSDKPITDDQRTVAQKKVRSSVLDLQDMLLEGTVTVHTGIDGPPKTRR